MLWIAIALAVCGGAYELGRAVGQSTQAAIDVANPYMAVGPAFDMQVDLYYQLPKFVALVFCLFFGWWLTWRVLKGSDSYALNRIQRVVVVWAALIALAMFVYPPDRGGAYDWRWLQGSINESTLLIGWLFLGGLTTAILAVLKPKA